MMDPTTYLIARGWRRSGSFPGTGADQWFDTFGLKKTDDSLELLRRVEPMQLEQALEIQLNRDELRDYVDMMHPPRPRTVDDDDE